MSAMTPPDANTAAAAAAPAPAALPSPCTRAHVDACATSQWLARFSGKLASRRLTMRSVAVPLPAEFVAWLQTDGLRLPEGCTACATRRAVAADGGESDDGSWDDDGAPPRPRPPSDSGDGDSDSDSDAPPAEEVPRFEALQADIAAAIAALGGVAFPKFHWSAPQDAAWLAGGSLQCRTPGDVFLLLKASDFVQHDIAHAYDHCSDSSAEEEGAAAPPGGFTLVLRKWCALRPAQLFRAFLGGPRRDLLALSQRQCVDHYPWLAGAKQQYVDAIGAVVGDASARLGDDGPPRDVVLDLYVDARLRTWVLDAAPWGPPTDPLLFDWPELLALRDAAAAAAGVESPAAAPELRIVDTAKSVRPDPLGSYRGPVDAVDLASGSPEGLMEMARGMEGLR